MRSRFNVVSKISAATLLIATCWVGNAMMTSEEEDKRRVTSRAIVETPSFLESVRDTSDLPWPNQDNINPHESSSGVSLPLPDNIHYSIEYDPITGEYVVVQTIGDNIQFRNPTTMTLEEYLEYDMSQNLSEYWDEMQEEEDAANRAFAPSINVGGERFNDIFGGNQIEIRPQGTAELTFGVNISKTENPRIPERQRRISTFDFDQRIQLNVVGNIGTKLQLTTNYNTEATFDFENQMKLEYTGDEDEIIKKIEAGNVSMPLPGTLITGSQSLFGLKLETQFGRLRNTTVFSQQKGERREIEVQGGAQTQLFEIQGDNYDANRHYFLGQYFHDNYDQAMSSLPVVGSGVNITRIEVWVVNTQANTQDVRNIIGFVDLGEPGNKISSDLPVALLTDRPDLEIQALGNPSNLNNDIYLDMIENPDVIAFQNANQAIQQMGMGYEQGTHFERVGNARKLNASEYSYNSRLGFISLRQALNNAEVLAVAYEYTLGGETFQVGTLSQDGFTAPSALVLKLLKSSITNVHSPMWDLMMKNVYNIGAFGVQRDNFRLDVWYNNPATGIDQNYIAREPIDGKLLIQVLNMDRLDVNGMAYADGIFDYIDHAATQGGLIESQNGRIFLPVVEPFGSHLEGVIRDGLTNQDEADAVVNSVVYQELYDSTKTAAQQIPAKNRFKIRGQYQSSSGSEIALNSINIPQGSVSVTAGGVKLVENQDYTVDYNLGRVRIINEGILESGTPIKISLESNSLFNIQTKTMLGTRFDYTVSDNLKLGATMLNLRERPLTQKVNIGDEPVNNTIVGLDVGYQKEADWITRMVDAIPLIDTKAKSNLDISAEGAYLIPGHSRAIGKDGNAYLDDFEGSQSTIDIRSINQWFLASTPKLQENDLFPEGGLENDLEYNYNRAKLSWYIIDPLFFRNNSLTPPNINEDIQSDHRSREVLENEVFPNRQLPAGTPPNVATFDMTYYPDERGPYNYVPFDGTATAPGLNEDGTLVSPEARWGGIQRALTTTDFESSNVQFIQFWLMDPFNEDSENTSGGEFYINLGYVSEDVLNDSELAYENGFPTTQQDLPVLESTWGFVPDPATFNVVNAFDNTTNSYAQQDIGIDGLNSQAEATYFQDYLNSLINLTPDALARYTADPAADDFAYFRSSAADAADLNTVERYKNYNGYEGNSNTSTPDGFPITATTIPNTEDINQDLTLSTIESYYQYKVSLRPGDLGESNIGSNYITDSFVANVENLPNGETKSVRWYQFKIPITDYTSRHGSISDFRSIRFIRMFLKGWSQEVTLRFARLELIRGEWRVFQENLAGAQEVEPNDDDPTTFNIAAVNIEENGNRDPVNYVIPPGIIREIDVGTANLRSLNEQSMSLSVCNLLDGDARAAYRAVNFDMRRYKRLQMFVHAEAAGAVEDLEDKEITCFVRMGSDFTDNYYEYEIPLKVTSWYSNDDNDIWPDENNMDIELKKLQTLKISRPQGYSLLKEYIEYDGDAQMKVKGNPNLANVVVVMIGIRNPDDLNNPYTSVDDGMSVCANVWVNELRLTDFNESGGWAAVARMNAGLADFGNLSVAGNISTPGFGTLEQRVQERQQETIRGVDANTTLKLGKFFPEDLGVQLPMYLGFSETVTTPQYDPLSPDVELADVPNLNDQRKKKAQTLVKRRSINFTNVKIAPKGKGGGGKPKAEAGEVEAKGKGKGKGGSKGNKTPFYSIQNFSVSYAYNELYQRDINTEFRINKNYRGSFNYTWNNNPKEIKPFAQMGVIKTSPYLKWLKEFNFYPGIKQFSFITEMDRTYETSRIRNNTAELFGIESDVLIQTQAMKTWNWTRQYNFKYDITKNLKFDLNANNVALIGEPQGVIDKEDQDWYQAYKDTVMMNIQNLGETTNYNQAANLSYKLPFDKLPLLDFISSDARYAGTYRWDRAPFAQDSLGNTIQNSRNLQLNAQANFLNLYNKIDYLKDINNDTVNKKKKNNKDEVDKDKVDGFGNVKEDEDKKDKISFNPLHSVLRLLMSVRNVSGSFSRNEGLLIPGYGRQTYILGMDDQFQAPGWPFVFGHQDTDLYGNPVGRSETFVYNAATNGYLISNPYQNQQYSETYNEQWNVRANLEPFQHFKVELTANKQVARNYTSFFRYDDDAGDFVFDSPVETGNYSATIITWPTAFIKDEDDYNSEVFRTFKTNRLIMSSRLNAENYELDQAENNGFYEGWGPTSQSVVIPAFIAAYTGQDPNAVSLDVFKSKVLPNWRVTYDGLTKNKRFKKYFKQFSISHTYRSTLSTQYITNLNYEDTNGDGLPESFDQAEFPNYITERQINTVTISEQLSPLIGFDMTIKTKGKNDPQLKIEWKKDRTVALAMTNFQITETKSNALVMGIGYKFTDIPNPFARKKGSKLPIKLIPNTDLDVRVDFTLRDNLTLIRKMEEDQNQVTAGQKLISIKGTVGLVVSQALTINLFYDQQLTRPKISTSFPTSNINAGLALRFTLTQ
ncbi:MAG: cell surface protein SprA [Flavobacteriales bacterium]|nr:cell surface protein SprA [Flavobacteriales bacterium]